jgi:hypothetical protein
MQLCMTESTALARLLQAGSHALLLPVPSTVVHPYVVAHAVLRAQPGPMRAMLRRSAGHSAALWLSTLHCMVLHVVLAVVRHDQLCLAVCSVLAWRCNAQW